jgi:hypothetical protein
MKAILGCAALAAAAGASGQTGESVKIKFSEKHFVEGVLIGGRPYVALSELSRAISGKDALARGLKVDGDTLSATDAVGGTVGGLGGGDVGGCGTKCILTLSGTGVISTKLLRVKGKGGAEQILVPLDQLAAAMGGRVQSGAASRVITVASDDVGLAAGTAGACKKCLLKFNPQAAPVNPQGRMVNPQAPRP